MLRNSTVRGEMNISLGGKNTKEKLKKIQKKNGKKIQKKDGKNTKEKMEKKYKRKINLCMTHTKKFIL